MKYNKVKDVVLELISSVTQGIGCEKLLPHEIEDDMTLRDDIELDSLDIVDLMIKIEKRFGIKIPDEDIETISGGVVIFLVNYVWEKVR